MLSKQKKTNHLLWRAGFGPSIEQQKNFRSTEEVIQSVFNNARKFEEIAIVPAYARNSGDRRNASKEEMKTMRQESREQKRQVNVAWLQKMFSDENGLREKMALFWHGHLACRADMGYFAQDYVNRIRRHALGKFGDLLFAVIKSPAMMMYLDTMKNKKGSPNENFARELMELFTLGKGNYSEQDIKEAARAFTGWATMPPAEFIVRENQHDHGVKKIFGKSGDFSGDDVVVMILENKQTAHYITTKIYKYFVNDTVNPQRVSALADSFYRSGYEIDKLMKEIFTSEWFYEEENIGVRIKSPVELIAGLTRTFNISYGQPSALMFPQRIMGHELLSPPNVAGWPGGKNWIDSSTLLYRLNLGSIMLSQGSYDIAPKGDVEEMSMMEDQAQLKGLKGLKPEADWNQYLALFANQPKEKIYAAVFEYLVQTQESQLSDDELEPFTNQTSNEEYIRTLTLRMLSTPEYQMC